MSLRVSLRAPLRMPLFTRGLISHCWNTLVLNCRNRQALIFGYVVPIFFLIAFASIFGKQGQPIVKTIAPLIVISILGGACFGLPINLVNERDRGVWRRYRLTPLSAGTFVSSTIISRLILVASSVLLQIALAMWLYNLPWPKQPLFIIPVFILITLAFIGIGLIIAGLANSIGAVQAMGQSLFLPMIMLGGVGVPYRMLPNWAHDISLFLPGRHAMELIERCYTHDFDWERAQWRVLTLAIIGLASLVAGWKLFRWEADERLRTSAWVWVGLAMCAWIAAGVLYKYFPAYFAVPTDILPLTPGAPSPFIIPRVNP
jgi:ABC-type transport system involved in cytochrome c biogenesis permease component